MVKLNLKLIFFLKNTIKIKSITMAGLFEGQSSDEENEGSNEPQSFLFENNHVYLATDLVVFDRPFFVGLEEGLKN